ncbi:MAG: aspartate 1-decarboxylase [Candidatus Marinimicrobia bacterium]|nr:aspartate 1-decarboxylase [Candidatus Neomarinimicrobiota bacterium]
MLKEYLKAKIHEARITEANLNYTGSIEIDEELMVATGINEYEKVLVANIDNGNRFETYVIKGKWGERKIGLNGAAARLGELGDKVIIMSFALLDEKDEENFKPKIIIVNEKNDIVKKI